MEGKFLETEAAPSRQPWHAPRLVDLEVRHTASGTDVFDQETADYHIEPS